MKTLLFTILICLLSLTALAEDYQTKQDILETYGEPYYQSGHKDIDVWYYPHKRMFIFFDKDKVVRIDVVTGEKI